MNHVNINRTSPANLDINIKNKVYAFLKEYIPEGTVVLPETIYDNADIWTIAYNKNDQVIGFTAQKYFDFNKYQVILSQSTYFAKELRKQKINLLLMQGYLIAKYFIKNPFKPLYFCSRTRVPAAFALMYKYNSYPFLDSEENNIKCSLLAKKIAKQLYGTHIQFDDRTFLMTNSYPSSSVFYQLPYIPKANKLTEYFLKNINYNENECIFIMMPPSGLIKVYFLYTVCAFLKKLFDNQVASYIIKIFSKKST